MRGESCEAERDGVEPTPADASCLSDRATFLHSAMKEHCAIRSDEEEFFDGPVLELGPPKQTTWTQYGLIVRACECAY
jgi:hypothetical protein